MTTCGPSKHTTALEQLRLWQLFPAEELGDRTPSQLWRRMQQLLGNAANPNSEDTFLQELLLQNLHSHIRMVLPLPGTYPWRPSLPMPTR